MSYKSDGADEDFVLHKLQPVLEEQLSFRLCLHYRDFVIGAGEYTPVGGLVNGGGVAGTLDSHQYVDYWGGRQGPYICRSKLLEISIT